GSKVRAQRLVRVTSGMPRPLTSAGGRRVRSAPTRVVPSIERRSRVSHREAMLRTPAPPAADRGAPPPVATSSSGELARRGWAIGLAVVVVVAAVLRLWMPGTEIVTTDEFRWNGRSLAFHTA